MTKPAITIEQMVEWWDSRIWVHNERDAIIRNAIRDLLQSMQWQPIDEDCKAKTDVDYLLFCPERGISNPERIEFGTVLTSRGSHHAWATHFMPLPAPPRKETP